MEQEYNEASGDFEYEKLSHPDHILLRPDSYIGRVTKQKEKQWIFNGQHMAWMDVTISPGLYKIFDEILVNAADNKVRDPSMSEIQVVVRPVNNCIAIFNDGKGIPIAIHKKEQMYIPQLIFGHLLTSSNFNDDKKKLTGGRNGYGAKLANIYSQEFIVETSDGRQEYKQIFKRNMTERSQPKIRAATQKGRSWTKITFYPDLEKFQMTYLEEDIVAVMQKRTMDMAGLFGKSLKVSFNGKHIKLDSFEDYVDLYLKKESEVVVPRIGCKPNERWEVIVAPSDTEFVQVSFVNSICTTKGGTHVSHVVDKICSFLVEKAEKKSKLTVKNAQVKANLMVFVNSMIENPSFDTQTKETLTLLQPQFGSSCQLSDDFLNKIARSEILEKIIEDAKAKEQHNMKKTDGTKTSRKLTAIEKLTDAANAGTKRSEECTLILTEGDSAKSLAIGALSVVDRASYGVYPLRGKLLNVRDATSAKINANKEIENLKKIIGLQHGRVYRSAKELRYGHILLMADQDYDGSHIKGLIINFFHHISPTLIQLPNFLQMFITPIVTATASKNILKFYTIPDYEEWKLKMGENVKKGWKIKYYKGLGTSNREECISYFRNLEHHRKEFVYEGAEDGDAIEMVFSKKRVEHRKEWILNYLGGSQQPLDMKRKTISYSEFINKELILFSLADLERSIPSLVDGFKPSQRKVFFGFRLKKIKNEIKVYQMVGYIGEKAAYHHGDASLAQTIIGMAQNFVGSNNINLLMPNGTFGSRLCGGKDCADPRYINSCLNPLTEKIFRCEDDIILKHLTEDELTIEPESYLPIIPMELVNGAEGIGTGWSTFIPCYDPLEIIDNLIVLLENEEMEKAKKELRQMKEMIPHYTGFEGSIMESRSAGTFDVTGNYRVYNEEKQVEITELPVKKWTDDYSSYLGSAKLCSNSDTPLITDLVNVGSDLRVHYHVQLNDVQFEHMQNNGGFDKHLKLNSMLHISNMVLFDEKGNIHKYDSPLEIMRAFYAVRKKGYDERLEASKKKAKADMDILANKKRFVQAVMDGELNIYNRLKAEIIEDLEAKGFQRKSSILYRSQNEYGQDDAQEHEDSERDFGYLLSMPVYSFTREKVKELGDKLDRAKEHYKELNETTPEEIYKRELGELKEEYLKYRKARENRQDFGRNPFEGPFISSRDSAVTNQRGRGRGRGQRSAGASSSITSGNQAGQQTRGRGGRGRRGRKATRELDPIDLTEDPGQSSGAVSQNTTSDDSLTQRFTQFGLNARSGEQMDTIAEENEVSSPPPHGEKRPLNPSLSSEFEDISEQNVQDARHRVKKPRHEVQETDNTETQNQNVDDITDDDDSGITG